jgi:CxxC motif-containing protein (DUF1111 family)
MTFIFTSTMNRILFSSFLWLALETACQKERTLDGLTLVQEDPTDSPLKDISEEWRERFAAGDALFEHPYRDSQGLGPYYIRQACERCHLADGKGPGSVTKMVVVENDGFTPSSDQSLLPFGHTLRPQPAAGASQTFSAPEDARIKKSIRIGPAVFGRGYMEAIADSEIERMALEQARRDDGISGRPNWVVYRSHPNTNTLFQSYVTGQGNIIGRFGLKARIATLDEFTADALQGDMGLTSPMRPDELPNPSGLRDDDLPGLDVDLDTVNQLADYLRLLDIPARQKPSDEGSRAFAQAQCSACHAPSLRTREDYPIPALAGIDAPVFSDLLLHDMGASLADGMVEDTATSREWRTAPLMGVRHLKSLMHDGRARTVRDAIENHAGEGSEANVSVSLFAALSESERDALIAFVEAL